MGTIAFSQFGLSVRSPGSGAQAQRPQFTDQNLFSSRLEARIDNYRRGVVVGDDFAVDAEIAARSAEVSDSLAAQDPKALTAYSSLLSGLTYSRAARVVTNVEFSLRKLSAIPSEEEAKAQTDKVVEAYKKRQLAKDASAARARAAEENTLAVKPQPIVQAGGPSPQNTSRGIKVYRIISQAIEPNTSSGNEGG